jgi:hypothetical protein
MAQHELPEGYVALKRKQADSTTLPFEKLQWCCVYDLDSGEILTDVTKVDCEAGLAWRQVLSPRATAPALPEQGNYLLICHRDHIEAFADEQEPKE